MNLFTESHKSFLERAKKFPIGSTYDANGCELTHRNDATGYSSNFTRNTAGRRWETPTFEETFKAFCFWDCAYNDGQDWDDSLITHWQPLPEPPKEKP